MNMRTGETDCWACGGSGVIQPGSGMGYCGVCQECQGSGKTYYLNGQQVSEEEFEDDDWDDDD